MLERTLYQVNKSTAQAELAIYGALVAVGSSIQRIDALEQKPPVDH